MDKTITLRFGNHDFKISLLSTMTVLYFCKSSFTNFATAAGLSTSIVAAMILLPFLAIFTYYFLINLKNIKWDGIILYLLCIIFFVITIKIHPEYSDRFLDVYNNGRFSAASVFSLGAGIYTYYIIRQFGDNVDKIYDTFRVVPYFVFALNLATLFNRSSEYAMDFGYQMELAAILFMVQYFYEKGNTKTLLFSIVAMLLGVLYGARASILGWAFFIVLYIIWKKKMNMKKAIMISLGLLAAVMYSSQTIMIYLYNLFYSLGLHSRTLYLIASGDVMAADTARQERIWPVLIDLLKGSSIFKMYGAYGDRYYLDPHYPYAHNIILEILVTFGLLLGAIIIVLIVLGFVHVFRKNKTKGGIMTIAFGSFSLCRLMVSSSFWIEPYFWAFLALTVNCILYYKHDHITKKVLKSD